MDTKAMYKLTYGLFVLTASRGLKDNGCIVNTVQQVTTDPNRIIVAVNKNNLTHDMIVDTGEFNVSVLSERASFDTFKDFGMRSGRDVDKFSEIRIARTTNGIPFIAGGQTNAVICASVVSSTDLGTHTLFLADVTDCFVLCDDESVTYSYYQKNIKGKPSPNAVPAEEGGQVSGNTSNGASAPVKGFICTVCGYIYEGETLPEDFICPLCNHDASFFEPLK